MPRQSGTKVERTRTFTGCRTCRSRHAKCDEAQPECGTCRRLGLTCGGYGARLFWITDDAVRPELQQSHRGSEYRYPLFSEVDRRLMSAELSDSLGKQSAMDILADIDSACDKLAGGNSAMIKGPFGVFQSIEEPSPADVLTSSPDTENSNTNTYPDTDSFIEEVQRHDWPTHIGDDLDLFTGPLDPSLSLNPEEPTGSDQVLLPDSAMTNFFLDNSMGVEGLALFSPNFITQAMESEAAGHGDSQVDDHGDNAFNHLENEVMPCPRGLPQANGGHLGLPEEAEPLLRYYKKHVAGERTSMQAKRKSPWEIIFLPCALETFAELSLWNEASHTRSTIFYTLLAHSALQLHLSNKPSTFSCDWKEIGIRNHERAQHHLRNALQLEMFGPKQANYKELLMAILGMAMTSLHNGTRAFRVFLLDAERLIRLRGLINQNPFKTRLLHHMYTHLRVIAESISLCAEPPSDTFDENNTRDLTHGRTFRITEDALNIGLDPAQEKTDEMGYNDIHLEIQGRWSHTLFPVIYGIPESLMTLLSQTVSLSNEKARLENVARCNPGVSVALARHTKTLENRIWAWTLALDPLGPPKPTRLDQDLMAHPQVRSMALAIHQALIIYFYRRVYDMNAMILQDLVKKTLDFLEPCLGELIGDQDFATSLAWPAFVAACEAVSPDLQERALKCLSVTDDKGIYFTPKPAKVIVPMIWDKRKESGDWTASWQSLVSDSLL
ncbi:fungal-specific transcription factor domain-containing protein [Fusarium solani]|uniref:Fungal-specific transcription factor domain-containing protein n=1 Tax=Fusarium solani TaxID=169388 RepID=A0A9P9HZ19_FUSSL|nr:fungal-specific transcription factor domain-containing protein [Fusarium solani]KAH7265808.1 fungal-specific transcription factor domain-containing protein [Fusarium solani]